MMNGLVFGLDLGLGSCGWAVLRPNGKHHADADILAMGCWMFDVPETARDHDPTSQVRRGHRLMRRTLRRRARRMAELRRLFRDCGLIAGEHSDALGGHGLDPWALRAAALDRPLAPLELAVALGHLARRRGYRPLPFAPGNREADEERKVLHAIAQTRERLASYRSTGDMFARDPAFRDRKRNRPGLHDRTQTRDAVIAEAGLIFRSQRELGNTLASLELEQAYAGIAFRQLEPRIARRPFLPCPLEPSRERAPRRAPSIERLRLLSRLAALRICRGADERRLEREAFLAVTSAVGTGPRLTFKTVRRLAGLADDESFSGVPREEETLDILARNSPSLAGTRYLQRLLASHSLERLASEPATLDAIAQALATSPDETRFLEAIAPLGLPETARAILAGAWQAGSMAFAGSPAHISAHAARRILSCVEQGLGYEEACAEAGYDAAMALRASAQSVADRPAFNRLVAELGAQIANPVSRKCLVEGLKQLWAMRNRWGLPDAIHLCLSPELGRNAAERLRMASARKKAAAQDQDLRAQLLELRPGETFDHQALTRFALWREQSGLCPYSQEPIPLEAALAPAAAFRLAPILPWSRFGRDSHANLVLCSATAARAKQAQTPCEWLQAEAQSPGWPAFRARIASDPRLSPARKRNLLFEGGPQSAARIRDSNLSDQRSLTRLMVAAATCLYRFDRHRPPPVLARPARLVSAMQKVLGLKAFDPPGDDRAHAGSAAVVAMLDDKTLEEISGHCRKAEIRGLAGALRDMELPGPAHQNLARTMAACFDQMLVARPECRRARGEGHAATIRQARRENGKIVTYERKSIEDLTVPRLADIKDGTRNKALVEAIRQWILDGRPRDRLPRSPGGHVIARVRLRAKAREGIAIRGGVAARGAMVRVDVFEKPDSNGKLGYYLVPVYVHQVMNRKAWPAPPSRAVAGSRDEQDWPVMDEQAVFRFSLYPGSYVQVTKACGEVLSGYFSALNRATGGMTLANPRKSGLFVDDHGRSTQGIGPRTLQAIVKFSVDRLGLIAPVGAEPRTWHGRVCSARSGPSDTREDEN